MQLYFIRHAQSTNNALWATTGSGQGRSEDPGLSETGYEQAGLLAEFLKSGNPDGGNSCKDSAQPGFGITHFYSSLMVRAVTTGTIAARALDLPLVAWMDLHEQGGIHMEDEQTGEDRGLEGNNRAYFREHFPDLILPPDFGEAGWWNCRPLETLAESRLRARQVLAGLMKRHGNSDDRVAVISHGGFYVDILAELTGLPETSGLWFSMNNAAITRIDFQDGRVYLTYHNRMDYLPARLVT